MPGIIVDSRLVVFKLDDLWHLDIPYQDLWIWIEIVFYIVYSLAGGLGLKYRWNFVEFLIDFQELGIF